MRARRPGLRGGIADERLASAAQEERLGRERGRGSLRDSPPFEESLESLEGLESLPRRDSLRREPDEPARQRAASSSAYLAAQYSGARTRQRALLVRDVASLRLFNESPDETTSRRQTAARGDGSPGDG